MQNGGAAKPNIARPFSGAGFLRVGFLRVGDRISQCRIAASAFAAEGLAKRLLDDHDHHAFAGDQRQHQTFDAKGMRSRNSGEDGQERNSQKPVRKGGLPVDGEKQIGPRQPETVQGGDPREANHQHRVRHDVTPRPHRNDPGSEGRDQGKSDDVEGKNRTEIESDKAVEAHAILGAEGSRQLGHDRVINDAACLDNGSGHRAHRGKHCDRVEREHRADHQHEAL